MLCTENNGCLYSTEWKDGLEWNDHTHRARCDDLYQMCLRPSTNKQQVGKPVVSEILKKTGSIWFNREIRELWLKISGGSGAFKFKGQNWPFYTL